MTDISRDILHQKLADAIAVASIPANAALWLADIDLLLRIGVSAGSFILICIAIWAKISRWWRK
jgi:hypothetical protein